MAQFSTIVTATDFSERSKAALNLAVTLARPGARLHVAHVIEAVHVRAEGYEEALHERLREHDQPEPGVNVEYHLLEGLAAEEILRLASQANADAIVIGSHGRTALERLLVGSVVETILRRSPCPVVVVRIPRPHHGQFGDRP